MASKGFMDETKRVFKGTCPNPARYWKFLDSSEDSDNIYFFCMKIFQALISSGKEQFLDDEHEAMYSTLMILEFYKNSKLKSEKWLDQTEKIFEDNKPKLFQHARWIIKLYIKNSQENQFAINFISSICHIPQKFSWQVEPGQQIQQALREASEYCEMIQLKRKDKPYKKLSQFSFDQIIKESKINAFSYCCFIDYIRSTNYQPKKKIWLHILDTLKGLIHSQRFTSKSYELVTIFLHFISIMIRFYGCAYQDLLKQMIYLINLLRNSPGHNAYLAQDLFQIMHNQLKSPGYSLRREIKRRFVNIDIKKAENLGSRKYYLTYRKIAFSNPQYCSINNLRKLIIYNILGCFKIDNISKLWATVQPLDSDTTFDLYYKIMNIIDITFNLETYQSIHKLTKQSITELFKSPWKPYRKLKPQEQSELAQLIVPEHPQRFFQFPNFQIVNVRPQSLVAQNNEHAINELFEQILQYPYNLYFYSSFLQFVFLGNDEELSRILQMICPYLITVQENNYQKLAFYLVPSREGECYLAEYLSTQDIWYRRHVFNVFRDRLLFPNISLQDPEIKDSFPSYLYTKSFHMYIREAQRKVPIQIFQCQLMIQDANGKSQKIIYFINNVLIGSSMESALTKHQIKKQKKNAYVDLLEVYLEKVKKLYPIALDITIRYRQPGTDSLITKEQKYLAIEDFQICNTPKPYFFGYKPNPLTQFIQVSILTQNASKVFKTQIETRQNFKRHEDPQIYESFRDLYMNMSAESIIVERSDGMKDFLKLLIDGVQIHDVQKFKITPAFTAKKMPLKFPIRHFLPFQT